MKYLANLIMSNSSDPAKPGFSYLFIFLSLLFQGCLGQTSTPKKEVYNSDFNWTISIPENFENVSAQEWAKMQKRGTEAIEKTIDEKIVNNTKTIFIFKSDQLHYFEANYQPFDPEIDGDYSETCVAVNDIIYETFRTQMPGIKLDTTRTVEKIDNLDFHKFTMRVEYPNKMVMKVLMYSRLFDKKVLAVNIMYVDNEKGRKMLDSWTKSKFKK